MSKVNEAEREAIRQAAEAATTLVEKLERDRTAIDERIASLRAVISAWESLSSKRPRRTAISPAPGKGNSTDKIKRGQVVEHIDSILKDGAYKEPELRKLIAERFQVAYNRSTVYSALRRGEKDERYEQDSKRWRLKTKGP